VYEVTRSPSVLGAVLGVRAIPMLMLAPISGYVADRFDKRRSLAASQFVMVVISVWLAALLAYDAVQVWHLFVFSLLAGVGAVFDRTLRNTLVFNSVPRAEAANAVALNSIAFSVTRAVGPGVAGFLIGAVGAAANFGIQGFLYVGVCLIALSVSAPIEQSGPRRASPWQNMKEGLRFVATDRIARVTFVLGLVPPLFLIPAFSALIPIFAADVHNAGPEGLGLMLSAVGVGGIVGGIAAAWTTRYDRTGLVQTLALLAFGASLLLFALAPNLELAVLWLALAGIAEMVHFTLHVTTLQMCAPEHMRGRMASLLPMFPAFISVGALMAGVLADLMRVEAVVVLQVIVATTIVITAWMRSSALRGVTLSAMIGSEKK
jgi:MFS family permease